MRILVENWLQCLQVSEVEESDAPEASSLPPAPPAPAPLPVPVVPVPTMAEAQLCRQKNIAALHFYGPMVQADALIPLFNDGSGFGVTSLQRLVRFLTHRV